MARVEVHKDRVVIRFTTAEKVAAMQRHDVVLERAAITSAVITRDPWVWLRGVRHRGTHIPGKFAMGIWRSLSGTDFVVVREGREAVVLDLDLDLEGGGHESDGWVGEFDNYTRVVISTVHAAELVQALRLDGPTEAVITVDTAS